MRKLLSVLAVSAVIFIGLSARNVAAQATQSGSSATSQANSGENQADTSSPAAPQHNESTNATTFQSKSATGKITAVSGDTFTIEVGSGSKETMQFVTDPNTAKSGDLKVGSEANVQYQSSSDGKNMATKVDIQG
jgi:hypothetical protein